MAETPEDPPIETPILRDRYIPHERVYTDVDEFTQTKQSFKKDADINHIMAQYEKTGLLTHLNKHQGNYGDFTNAVDYHTAINMVQEAEEMFLTIPAKIRAKFQNDPAEFLHFVQNPENLTEMQEMGLAPLTPAPGSTPDAVPEAPLQAPEPPPSAPDTDPTP